MTAPATYVHFGENTFVGQSLRIPPTPPTVFFCHMIYVCESLALPQVLNVVRALCTLIIIIREGLSFQYEKWSESEGTWAAGSWLGPLSLMEVITEECSMRGTRLIADRSK